MKNKRRKTEKLKFGSLANVELTLCFNINKDKKKMF